MQQEESRKNLRISLGGTGNMKQFMSVCEKFQKEKEEKKREISWDSQITPENVEKK